jgi:hypothetical protein
MRCRQKVYNRDDWGFVMKEVKVLRELENQEVIVEGDVGMIKEQFSWMN